MTEDDKKYRQGRSKEQYKSSSIGAFISGLGFILTLILIAIFG